MSTLTPATETETLESQWRGPPLKNWMEGLEHFRDPMGWSFFEIAKVLLVNDRSVRRWFAWVTEKNAGRDPNKHPDAAYPRWEWMHERIVRLAMNPPPRPETKGPVHSQQVAKP